MHHACHVVLYLLIRAFTPGLVHDRAECRKKLHLFNNVSVNTHTLLDVWM